jgi:polyisoprenoid-binding protein YceI
MKSIILAFALLAPSFAAAAPWAIDTSHTNVRFAVKHMMMSDVWGKLGNVTGTVDYDDKDVTKSKVDITIDVNSINTDDAKRDGHLKSPDFFDTAKHPTATFKSKKVEKAGKKLKITGDLMMHGVTKEVVLEADVPATPVKDPWGMNRTATSATTTLNRKDWGVSWNKALDSGGVLVADEVRLFIELELTSK